MTGTSSRVNEKIDWGSPFSRILNSSFRILLIGWLLRSITRTCRVTSSVSIFKVEFSSISALAGSGVGVGFGFKTGGGGGAPSCGAIRRPGRDCAGVGVVGGISGVGDGATLALAAVRGRESTGCWALLPTAIARKSALIPTHNKTALRRARKKRE